MFSFHLFIVNIGKRRRRSRRRKRKSRRRRRKRSQNKNAHRRIQRFTGWVAPVLAMHPTLATKKEGSIILASMLWSQNTDTFIHLFVFSFVFICLFVLEVSPSHFTPWPRVSQYRKKGRFVVVLSSHLRCSPFKRHRFSYKLCDCEWVGRGGGV